MPDPMTPEREGRKRSERDRCSHDVPLYGDPVPECRECEIVWRREGLKNARQAVERHERELAKLGVRDA